MTGPRLELASAEVRQDGVRLLGPLTLTLADPGLTMVMGPNGAGKSLFLRLAQGLIAPSSGQVLWDSTPARQTMASRGFMFQTAPVMRRSVAANVAFPLQAAGLPKAEAGPRVDAVLTDARLSEKSTLPAAQLSGGERQRMALARALVSDPNVLLMDEPSASLDPASTRMLEDLIGQARDRGIMILMSTHNVGQARRLADHVLFFDQGALAESAPAAQFFDHPATDAARRYLEGRL